MLPVILKQGLQEGISEVGRLMWESPQVQGRVEGRRRRGRRRMRTRQGRRIEVEASKVALSRRRSNFSCGSKTAGVRKERGKDMKLLPESSL